MKRLNVQTLVSHLKKICKEEGVVDIVIFGSFVKGKAMPRDIDIAIIFKNEDYNYVDNISAKVRKLFGEKYELNIEPLFISKIFKEPLYLTLVHEGYSAKEKGYIHKKMGTKSLVLITYDLKKLTHSQKTMFGYALVGRKGEKGILKELRGKKEGRNTILVPTKSLDVITDFLKTWGVKFNVQRFLKIKSII